MRFKSCKAEDEGQTRGKPSRERGVTNPGSGPAGGPVPRSPKQIGWAGVHFPQSSCSPQTTSSCDQLQIPVQHSTFHITHASWAFLYSWYRIVILPDSRHTLHQVVRPRTLLSPFLAATLATSAGVSSFLGPGQQRTAVTKSPSMIPQASRTETPSSRSIVHGNRSSRPPRRRSARRMAGTKHPAAGDGGG